MTYRQVRNRRPPHWRPSRSVSSAPRKFARNQSGAPEGAWHTHPMHRSLITTFSESSATNSLLSECKEGTEANGFARSAPPRPSPRTPPLWLAWVLAPPFYLSSPRPHRRAPLVLPLSMRRQRSCHPGSSQSRSPRPLRNLPARLGQRPSSARSGRSAMPAPPSKACPWHFNLNPLFRVSSRRPSYEPGSRPLDVRGKDPRIGACFKGAFRKDETPRRVARWPQEALRGCLDRHIGVITHTALQAANPKALIVQISTGSRRTRW